ncbi:hypothetical protein RND71_033567 [Anisodus tanguticus]|uniref:Uncharacterized protein n=1 Tax=Anisodus tanguticus TaxID=243964 RepID=A0AAE1UW97_9SOLA|nr:hypothetical protein RND71_033567 [Anisodus tanguticus]
MPNKTNFQHSTQSQKQQKLRFRSHSLWLTSHNLSELTRRFETMPRFATQRSFDDFEDGKE